MNGIEVLTEALGRIPQAAASAVDGADEATLVERPDADGNTIAWLVWHLGRVIDAQVAEVAGTEEVWLSEGWRSRFDLPLDAHDTGYGHTSAEVAAVRADAELLAGYVAQAVRSAVEAIGTFTDADLDRVVDDSFTPPVTLGVRLVSIVDDAVAHAGQAAFLRGVLDRR